LELGLNVAAHSSSFAQDLQEALQRLQEGLPRRHDKHPDLERLHIFAAFLHLDR